jgi:hypothetical protein
MSLSLGVAGGLIMDGLTSINNPWRVDYYVGRALIGELWILVFFTFPETAFKRVYTGALNVPGEIAREGEKPAYLHAESGIAHEPSLDQSVGTKKYSYAQQLKLFNGSYTQESVLVMILRPLILILLPQVRRISSRLFLSEPLLNSA